MEGSGWGLLGTSAAGSVERETFEITASDRLAAAVGAAPVGRRVCDSRRLNVRAGD